LLNEAQLDLQQKALHLQGDGRIQNGVIQNAANIFFSNNAYLGGYGHNLELEGDTLHLRQFARLGDITIRGVLAVEDTLSTISQTTNIEIEGAIINRGAI
jgi:hypothetical protein